MNHERLTTCSASSQTKLFADAKPPASLYFRNDLAGEIHSKEAKTYPVFKPGQIRPKFYNGKPAWINCVPATRQARAAPAGGGSEKRLVSMGHSELRTIIMFGVCCRRTWAYPRWCVALLPRVQEGWRAVPALRTERLSESTNWRTA